MLSSPRVIRARDRDLDVALDRDVQRHIGEAAGRQEAVRVVEMHLDEHGARARLEFAGHPGHGAGRVRSGLAASLTTARLPTCTNGTSICWT